MAKYDHDVGGSLMKLHEQLSIKICQVLPESMLSDSFKEYCMAAAVRELNEKKRELIRKNWQCSELKCKLREFKRTK